MKPLFIHIPKTAGISIKRYLFETYNTPIFEGHFTCQQMKAKASFIAYEYDHIFTLVRNPYARLVSTYLFLKEKMKEYTHTCIYDCSDLTIPFKETSFKEFVYFFIKEENLNFQYMNTYMFLPQSTWLDTKDDVKICKMEEINKLNFKINHFNKAEKEYDWKSFYTPNLKKIVYTYYKNDFKKFDYER
tara:strand:+ start:923 stop:1486 length:564 start_codon:yes stop_codon:yes gene_type:complete